MYAIQDGCAIVVVAMPVSNPFAHGQYRLEPRNRGDFSYEEKGADSGKQRYAEGM